MKIYSFNNLDLMKYKKTKLEKCLGGKGKNLSKHFYMYILFILGTNLDYYNPYIVCRTITEYMFCPILESVSS